MPAEGMCKLKKTPSPARVIFFMSIRTVIFVNGTIPDPDLARSVLTRGDYIVAADGGLNHLRRLSIQPDLVVGDLDSVSADERLVLENSGVEIELAQVEKDETDLELAIRSVIKRGFKQIILAGALGNRVDHTLGNIYLLGMPGLEDVEISLDDGMVEIFLVRNRKEIHGSAGDLVSLLPVNGVAEGVITSGLYYPLNGETLLTFYTRGISNLMTGNCAAVSLTSGLVLCIHTRNFDGMEGDHGE